LIAKTKLNLMRNSLLVICLCLVVSNHIWAQQSVNLVLIKDPYTDARSGPEILPGPDLMDTDELLTVLDTKPFHLLNAISINMPTKWDHRYGEWNRASLTNNVLMHAISDYEQDEVFFIGLLSGNKSVQGMLAGLQHLGPDRKPLKDDLGQDIIGLPRLGDNQPLTVGLIWMNPEPAYNTPDRTLKGDMGGMNIAVVAGKSNASLRLQAGLDPPIAEKHILMMGSVAENPYEALALNNSMIRQVGIHQMSTDIDRVLEEVKNLHDSVDLLYIHLDLRLLQDMQVNHISDLLTAVCLFPKVAALGIASYPDEVNPSLSEQVNEMISAALSGIKNHK